MDFFVTLNQILILFILLLAGFVIRKLKIVDDTFSKNLSNFLFNIVFPAMIIHSMNYPFSIDVLVDSGWLIMISMGIIIFSIVVSEITIKLLKVDALSRNIYQFGIVFSNFGFMGFPVVESIFGKEGVFYASIFAIPIYFMVNSIGIMMIERGEENTIQMNFKNVVNAPIIAVFIGFFIFIFSVKLPTPIEKTIDMVAATTTPMSMILAGIILANSKFSELFSNYKVYIVSFIRLIFLPLCMLWFLKLFNLDLLMIGIPVIITAMPIAANASMLAEKYGGNAYLGAQSVFISTLLSILTIPMIAYLL